MDGNTKQWKKKMKENKRYIIDIVDDNFKFNKNGRKFSKQVENTVGKGEIIRNEQFLLFP